MIVMMTSTIPRSLSSLVAAAAILVTATLAPAQPTPGSLSDQQERVQITEVGLLRALVMVDEASQDLQQRLVAALVNRDFRVFESPQFAATGITAKDIAAAGEAQGADLVIYASVKDELADQTGDSYRFSAIGSVKIVNRVNGQTLAVSPDEDVYGGRSKSQDRARRDARRKASDAAVAGAVERVLASAHKMMVYELVFVNVFTESDLLAKMEDMARMEGVYSVRRIAFDRKTNEAKIEIISSPREESFWRAFAETHVRKSKVNVQVTPNGAARNKYPDWFQPPSN
jgi:hypothetical protein